MFFFFFNPLYLFIFATSSVNKDEYNYGKSWSQCEAVQVTTRRRFACKQSTAVARRAAKEAVGVIVSVGGASANLALPHLRVRSHITACIRRSRHRGYSMSSSRSGTDLSPPVRGSGAIRGPRKRGSVVGKKIVGHNVQFSTQNRYIITVCLSRLSNITHQKFPLGTEL